MLLVTTVAPIGDWSIGDHRGGTIEAFFASLSSLAAPTRNQYVQVLKASFRWAARKATSPDRNH